MLNASVDIFKWPKNKVPEVFALTFVYVIVVALSMTLMPINVKTRRKIQRRIFENKTCNNNWILGGKYCQKCDVTKVCFLIPKIKVFSLFLGCNYQK